MLVLLYEEGSTLILRIIYRVLYVFLVSKVTHYYFINFVDPRVSEAHSGYTSLHKYVITVPLMCPKHQEGAGRKNVTIKIISTVEI